MKVDSIFIFEPEQTGLLYPFSVMHPLWELSCGALRLFEKIQMQFPEARLIYEGRDKHLNAFLRKFEHKEQSIKKENLLIFHSAVLPTLAFWSEIEDKYSEYCIEKGDESSVSFTVNGLPVLVYLTAKEYINPSDKDRDFLPKTFNEFGKALPNIEISEPRVIDYLWHALDFNAEAIADDSRFFKNHFDFEIARKGAVHLLNNNHITIGENCKIAPGVVLDADEGPIIIGDNVKIMANSAIIGPAYIGSNSIIKIGAKIYGGNSFGEYCKVGGEVENSIIQGYSNKQHEGFLGHSFIGEWVNIGADTNNSDLKNTYANIKVQFRNATIDTGRMFLGLLCGDHTKTAINTAFNTGTVCGIAAIIVADGMLPTSIPSFAWRGTKGSGHYKLEKAVEVAKIVKGRRNCELYEEEIELMRLEYESTLASEK